MFDGLFGTKKTSANTQPRIVSIEYKNYKLFLHCNQAMDLDIQPSADEFELFLAQQKIEVQSAFLQQLIHQQQAILVLSTNHQWQAKDTPLIRYTPKVAGVQNYSKRVLRPFEKEFKLENSAASEVAFITIGDDQPHQFKPLLNRHAIQGQDSVEQSRLDLSAGRYVEQNSADSADTITQSLDNRATDLNLSNKDTNKPWLDDTQSCSDDQSITPILKLSLGFKNLKDYLGKSLAFKRFDNLWKAKSKHNDSIIKTERISDRKQLFDSIAQSAATKLDTSSKRPALTEANTIERLDAVAESPSDAAAKKTHTANRYQSNRSLKNKVQTEQQANNKESSQDLLRSAVHDDEHLLAPVNDPQQTTRLSKNIASDQLQHGKEQPTTAIKNNQQQAPAPTEPQQHLLTDKLKTARLKANREDHIKSKPSHSNITDTNVDRSGPTQNSAYRPKPLDTLVDTQTGQAIEHKTKLVLHCEHKRLVVTGLNHLNWQHQPKLSDFKVEHEGQRLPIQSVFITKKSMQGAPILVFNFSHVLPSKGRITLHYKKAAQSLKDLQKNGRIAPFELSAEAKFHTVTEQQSNPLTTGQRNSVGHSFFSMLKRFFNKH